MTAQQLLVVFGGTSGGKYLGDQWQRDAAGTWSEFTGPRPSARRSAVMVYDPVRHRLILFGGSDPMGQSLGDTWEFDGTAWTQATPIVSPPARQSSAMVFVTTRGKPLLYGGAGAVTYDDTWEYDAAASTWSPLSLPTKPSSRAGHMMAYDPGRNVVVLFGGSSGFLSTRNDTWELGLFGWLDRTMAGPPGRNGGVMAYSDTRDKMVLFGGTSGGEASDTWEYDGAAWTQVATGTKTPPARASATAVTDGSGDVVMIGGVQAFSDAFDDVWRYGSDMKWVEQTPQLTPPARATPIAYDTVAQTSLIISGVGNGFPQDSWQFDGSWQLGVVPPDWRFHHGLAYDETQRRAVMFGGVSGGFQVTDSTYCYSTDSRTWSPLGGPTPPARTDFAFGYDASIGGMVAFGGYDGTDASLHDTWELVGDTWTERPQATWPTPRGRSSIAFDARHGASVLVDADGVTWRYQDHAWQVLPVDSPPPAQLDTPLVYDPMRGRIVMFATADDGLYLAVWELAETGWRKVDAIGAAPEGRQRAGYTYDRRRRAYVVFGGENVTHVFGDTWVLQYHSLTPDENCANAIDDDGDFQIDAADPDCN
jgi:hypothetical protein